MAPAPEIAARGQDRGVDANIVGPVPISYGDSLDQTADLHLPAGAGRVPVVVLIHGGFWRSEHTRAPAASLARDVAAHGAAAWNLEYRRIGTGGGWPATFDDVAAGIDALALGGQQAARGRLDLSRVVAVGHSAGGTLAVWAASRPVLPKSAPGSDPRVTLRGAVSQAGVLDLVWAASAEQSREAVHTLLGGSPVDVPERYAIADPTALVPIGVPVTLVHSRGDGVVSVAHSERYAAAATAAGDEPTLIRPDGSDHSAVVDVNAPEWRLCRDAALRLADLR